jgi:hypothetical protein
LAYFVEVAALAPFLFFLSPYIAFLALEIMSFLGFIWNYQLII